tara:strand:- start:508 stop:1071 length:564 start_codon:yes stop_codon:yes gene_type:complete
MKKTIINSFNESKKLNNLVYKKLFKKIIASADLIKKTISQNGNIIWCGNGGSAAQAEHFASELIGRFKKTRRPIKSISLTSNTSSLTCISNDFGYDNIFSRQLEGVADTNDLLFVFSTSGNSKNIIKVLNKAKKMKIKVISFLGKNGGLAKNKSSIDLIIPSNSTARIQEYHLLIGHILCELIDDTF